MVDYGKAIKRPFSDWKKLSIGALLYLVPFVNIVTGFFASGYSLLCAKTAMSKKYNLPEWTNWGDLFVKGILAFVIGIIYSLPAIILGLVGGGLTLINIIRGGNFLSILSAAGPILIIAVLLLIIAGYISPMAIMNFISKNSFGAAFNFEIVFKKAFTGKYFITWVLLIIYSMALGIIAFLINMVTQITIIIPLVVGAFVNIILSITGMTMFGELYSEIK